LEEKIFDDNLEPKVMPVLHNCGKRVTGGSQDHYGSSYGQPHPISNYSN
ncbi:18684_t:CDS:2, partial [Gigaspora margarita]